MSKLRDYFIWAFEKLALTLLGLLMAGGASVWSISNDEDSPDGAIAVLGLAMTG